MGGGETSPVAIFFSFFFVVLLFLSFLFFVGVVLGAVDMVPHSSSRKSMALRTIADPMVQKLFSAELVTCQKLVTYRISENSPYLLCSLHVNRLELIPVEFLKHERQTGVLSSREGRARRGMRINLRSGRIRLFVPIFFFYIHSYNLKTEVTLGNWCSEATCVFLSFIHS